MGPNTPSYNLATIRDLLHAAFTAPDLRRLFLYTSNPKLKPVYDRFSEGDGLVDMVDKVIIYCQKQALLPDLLREVKEKNPDQYAEFEAKLPGPAPRPVPPVVSLPAERAPSERTVEIDVSQKRVALRYGDRRYEGPNQVDWEELLRQSETPERYGETLFRGILHYEPLPGRSRRSATLFGYDRAVEDSESGLRVELRLADEDLHRVGWEYLKDWESDIPLAAQELTRLYVRLGEARKVQPLTARPLKILVALCNPTTLGQPGNRFLQQMFPLDVALEAEIIKSSLRHLADSGVATYHILESRSGAAVTLDALVAELRKGCHVLHILAHHLVVPERGYHLVMEAPDGSHDFVPAAKFAARVAGSDLRLVVLAAGESAYSRDGPALEGLGAQLVQRGIPAVVAMKRLPALETLQIFAQRFYDALARSGRIDVAMAAARQELYWRHDWSAQWGVPVLLMGTRSGQLFEVDEPAREL